MSIRVKCPNGHTCEAPDSLAGKVCRCPKCKARVAVPMPPARSALSESAVLDFIGKPDDQSVRTPHTRVSKSPGEQKPEVQPIRNVASRKECPHCEREIPVGHHVCPHCRMYIAALSDF